MATLDHSLTLLTSLTAALREDYLPDFVETTHRFGRKINRTVTPSRREVTGDGVNIQLEEGKVYAARFSRNIHGAFPTPRGYRATSYKPTLSEAEADNDFSVIKSSARTTWMELQRIKTTDTNAIGDIAERLYKQMFEDVDESRAIHRVIRSTAQVGTVHSSDAPKQDDAETYDGATATPTASGEARFKVEDVPIAIFQPNRLIDVVDASTNAVNVTVRVRNYNPRDKSIGVIAVDDDLEDDTATTLDSSLITTSDLLYLHDEKDKGMVSLGEWFASPTASEDFFGKDRTDGNQRHLRPTVVGPSSTATFTKTYFDDLAIALGHVAEDPDAARMAWMSPEMHQSFRDEMGEDVMAQWPTDSARRRIVAQYGFDSALYRHPLLGMVALEADALCPTDAIWLPRLGDWEALYGLPDRFTLLPGELAQNWYREQADEPNTGKGTVFRVDGMEIVCDVCLNPRMQGKIENLSP